MIVRRHTRVALAGFSLCAATTVSASGPQIVDRDTDHDGLPDLRYYKAVSGGENRLADLIAAYESFERPIDDSGHLLYDRDHDGTDDRPTLRFRIGAGEFIGNFQDQLRITRSRVVIEGSGPSRTLIGIQAGCGAEGAGPGTLDDGDGLVDFYYTVLIDERLEQVSLRSFRFSGGSTRSDWTRLPADDPAECDINDVDHDGLGNGVDPSPGGTCSGSWCPLDSHYFLYAGWDTDGDGTEAGVERLTLERLELIAIDRTAIAGLNRSHEVVIRNCLFEGIGEHSVWLSGSDLTVRDNQLRHCGCAKGPCLLLPPASGPIERVRIVGNEFTECAGECVGSEFGPYAIRNLTIADNRLRWAVDRNRKSAIRFIAYGAGNLVERVVIKDNHLVAAAGWDEALVMFESAGDAPPIGQVEIEGNVLSGRLPPNGENRHVILLRRVTSPWINSNRIEIDPATDARATAIHCIECGGGTLSRNRIELKGARMTGVRLTASEGVAVVRNNLMIEPVRSEQTTGISLTAANHNLVERNQVRGAERGAALLLGASLNSLESNLLRSTEVCVSIASWVPASVGNRIARNRCVDSTLGFVDEAPPDLNEWADNSER